MWLPLHAIPGGSHTTHGYKIKIESIKEMCQIVFRIKILTHLNSYTYLRWQIYVPNNENVVSVCIIVRNRHHWQNSVRTRDAPLSEARVSATMRLSSGDWQRQHSWNQCAASVMSLGEKWFNLAGQVGRGRGESTACGPVGGPLGWSRGRDLS